jgi:hypothetical protein
MRGDADHSIWCGIRIGYAESNGRHLLFCTSEPSTVCWTEMADGVTLPVFYGGELIYGHYVQSERSEFRWKWALD